MSSADKFPLNSAPSPGDNELMSMKKVSALLYDSLTPGVSCALLPYNGAPHPNDVGPMLLKKINAIAWDNFTHGSASAVYPYEGVMNPGDGELMSLKKIVALFWDEFGGGVYSDVLPYDGVPQPDDNEVMLLRKWLAILWNSSIAGTSADALGPPNGGEREPELWKKINAIIYDSGLVDPDAQAWADGVNVVSSVEATVIRAVSNFVKGCKADASPNGGVSNWDALKSVQLLAGPGTFAGIAVPLKGAAPTFFNFVGGDYDPATGLLGNGSTKYIDSNRNNNADPQNNQSMWTWLSSATQASSVVIGAAEPFDVSGATSITADGASLIIARNRSSTGNSSGASSTTGILGMSRHTSGTYALRIGDLQQARSSTSQTPFDGNVMVFARTGPRSFSSARISAYGIGEAVDLTALDDRLTTLMAAIAAAHQ